MKRGLSTVLLAGLFVPSSLLTAAAEDKPFHSNGKAGRSDRALGNEAFCATRTVSAPEAAEIEGSGVQSLQVAQTLRLAGSVTVPVWFHVLEPGTVTEDCTVPAAIAAQIETQIEVLNDSFDGGTTGGAATPFTFVSNGTTCRKGPWYTMTPGSDAESQAKAALRTGGAGTLNIYTASPGDGSLGWATFPWRYERDPQNDGVVLLFTTLPGGSEPDHTLGDNAVHQVGHWLGLYHTYEGGCSLRNDQVTDTHAERVPAFECVARDTCTQNRREGLDPIENFLDETPDSCKVLFTPGQAVRMDNMHLQYREP